MSALWAKRLDLAFVDSSLHHDGQQEAKTQLLGDCSRVHAGTEKQHSSRSIASSFLYRQVASYPPPKAASPSTRLLELYQNDVHFFRRYIDQVAIR